MQNKEVKIVVFTNSQFALYYSQSFILFTINLSQVSQIA